MKLLSIIKLPKLLLKYKLKQLLIFWGKFGQQFTRSSLLDVAIASKMPFFYPNFKACNFTTKTECGWDNIKISLNTSGQLKN